MLRWLTVLMLLGAFALCAAQRPKAPSTIVYQDKTWHIQYVQNIHDTLGKSSGVYIGYAHVNKKDSRYGTIEVRSDLTITIEARTIYHELEHVVTGEKFISDEMNGHTAIGNLSVMVEIIGRNPDLARYFQQAYSYKELK